MAHGPNQVRAIVAYYDTLSSTESVAASYDLAMNWMASLDVTPDRIGVTGEGFSGKMVSFSRASQSLLSKGFNNVKAIEVIASASAPTGVNDFIATAIWSRDHGTYLLFGVDTEKCSLGSRTLLAAARAFAEVVQPGYGIGYERASSLGPIPFALGIGGGRPVVLKGQEYDEAIRRSSWSHEDTWKYAVANGLLRDIFTWNFLNETQLRRDVGGASLETWIRSHPDRGMLSPFAAGLTLWEVDDANICAILDVLWNAGAIFNPKVHQISSG